MVAAVESAPVLADEPELVALAQLASLPASRMAAAFSNPQDFFKHMSLEELTRLEATCKRMAEFQKRLTSALDVYVWEVHRIMQASEPTVTVGVPSRKPKRRSA